MKKVFVSYHWMSNKVNGFGNWIGEFEEGAYEDDPAKFILDVERTISELLTNKLNIEVKARVLWFR